ncbi:MAG: hypothetical protein AMJ79_01685 [Phycisphaerae bacterium SM23_30]|nr:MAG: hypothetical protein AMJ79_01685 [Phycisphaerae bacterium SM23_30]
MISPPKTTGGRAGLLIEDSDQCLWVRRCHGLGNVICLLPVLDRLHYQDYAINVITQPDWLDAFSALRPDFAWYNCTIDAPDDDQVVDLDDLTRHSSPCEHRTDEFGRLLAVDPPFPPPALAVPDGWTRPFEHLRDAVVFAPEGGHPSRTWPVEQAALLKDHLADNNLPQKLVLVGNDPAPEIPCNVDTRGKLQLTELFGLLAAAGVVVTMDSAVLHIAAALKTPTVAIFGGVDPAYRIRPEQPVVVIQANVTCCPCNKQETCRQSYNCIRSAAPTDITQAVQLAKNVETLTIKQVNCLPKRYLTQVSQELL